MNHLSRTECALFKRPLTTRNVCIIDARMPALYGFQDNNDKRVLPRYPGRFREAPQWGARSVFMSKRRKYSPEFKRGAVEQASQPGVSCAQVARELRIRPNSLSRWKREAETEGRYAFRGAGPPRDEEMAHVTAKKDNSVTRRKADISLR